MKRFALAAGVLLGILLLAPTAALAADGPTLDETVSAVNTTWVIVAGVLVMFMQAGFLFLEVGFSRAKNAGLGVVKILTNYSICAIAYWATGFALAFGGAGTIAGTHGWFLDVGHTASEAAGDFPCGLGRVAVFLGIEAIAVAVFEIEPEILDGFTAQLFPHTLVEPGGKIGVALEFQGSGQSRGPAVRRGRPC